MNKLTVKRKAKALFMKWNLHQALSPFKNGLKNGVFMSELSQWRQNHPPKLYDDFFQPSWDYERRYKLYEEIGKAEDLFNAPIDYLEFGVAGGHSFKWWLQKNKEAASRFYGFDTFEGLPEQWGHFSKGSMAHSLEALNINDPRVSFYKGLFQQTLIPFLEGYENKNKKLVHLDADLFSSTIFTLSQLYRFLKEGDLLFFDEFAVPQHEFLAFKIFSEAFYLDYEVIGAANNYLFVAIKILQPKADK